MRLEILPNTRGDCKVLPLDDLGENIGIEQTPGHPGFRIRAESRDSYARAQTSSTKFGSSENRPTSDRGPGATATGGRGVSSSMSRVACSMTRTLSSSGRRRIAARSSFEVRPAMGKILAHVRNAVSDTKRSSRVGPLKPESWRCAVATGTPGWRSRASANQLPNAVDRGAPIEGIHPGRPIATAFASTLGARTSLLEHRGGQSNDPAFSDGPASGPSAAMPC